MAAKKRSAKKTSTSAKKKTAARSPATKKPAARGTGTSGTSSSAPEGRFWVLVAPGPHVDAGSKLHVLHVAESAAAAKKFVAGLTSASPNHVCIVEKSASYVRRPQIVLEEV